MDQKVYYTFPNDIYTIQNIQENMSEEKNNDVDEQNDIVSDSIGVYGKWQLKLTFLLSLVNIPCTWHIFAFTFQAAEKKFWCARPTYFQNVNPDLWMNYTQPFGHCSIMNMSDLNSSVLSNIHLLKNVKTELCACDKWEFEDDGRTLIEDFNLVCDRHHLINMAEMTFLCGVAIGGLVGGIISDKYGRKRTLILCIFLQALLGTIIAVTPWFEMYVVVRTLLGFISVSVVFSGFVLSVELVGGIWRIVAGVSYLFPVAVSYMTISGIAWLLRDWRHLQLAISLPGFLFLGLWWVLPESPLWLLAMGRNQEVMTILQNAAKTNKKQLPPNLDKQLLTLTPDAQTERAGVLDLFKTPQMRKTTFLLCIIWFVYYLLYYGIVLNLGNIGGDLYINSTLSGAVEIPAIAVTIPILLKLGRRWPLSLTISIAGVACLLIVPMPYIYEEQWIITTLTMLGKFSVSSTNVMAPIYTAELYPTTIRNIGVGASNVSAGIALMLVPYLWELKRFHPIVPMTVLGVAGLVGGLTVLLLPDTGNEPLNATVKQQNTDRRLSTARRSSKKGPFTTDTGDCETLGTVNFAKLQTLETIGDLSCFLQRRKLVVLELVVVKAQLPPRINIPGAILLPSNRQLPLKTQRLLNPDNVPLPIRVRKPVPNVLPISIPIREEPEEDSRSIEYEEDSGRLNIPSIQSSLKQSSDDEVSLPKPIQFRPERPVLPIPVRQTLRQLDEEPPALRQQVRQPPSQAPQQQPNRQKVRVQANPKPIPQHFDDEGRRTKNRKPPVQILRKYRTDNEDGSITWGFENEDGTFKEETIGADCVIRGKYGYIDPEGTRREYNYETGNKCDPQEEDELPLEEPLPKPRPSKNAFNLPSRN
ncbi:hypothetical protein FQR65_LT08873 [Abscondita terminalis]|nr:hypothetical protein FQR65_LT08873 [Abscondita terminalis]